MDALDALFTTSRFFCWFSYFGGDVIYNVITLVNLTLEFSVRQPQVFDNLQELNPIVPIVKSLPWD